MPTCIRCHYIYSDTINLCIYIKSAHPRRCPQLNLSYATMCCLCLLQQIIELFSMLQNPRMLVVTTE